MRLLAKVTIPLEKEDEALASGALSGTLHSAMERIRPEASYFFEEDGKRTCLFVFNLDLQALLKPLFQNLDATVQVTPVMNSTEFEQLGDPQSAKRVGNTETSPTRDPGAKKPELLTDISPVPATWPTPGEKRRAEAHVEPRRA